MRLFHRLLLLIFVLCISISCKDDDDFNSNSEQNNQTVTSDIEFQSRYFGNATTANFMGVISNREGQKLSGVKVTIDMQSVFTDQNGVFILNEVNVYENFAYIKTERDGYIDGSRVVIPRPDASAVNYISITLLEDQITETVNSGEVSKVDLPDGSSVTFTGDFIYDNGQVYEGQVNVIMHYLEPNTPETFQEMPGSLFAQTETFGARTLETYGMISVDLVSPSGESLNIDPEHPALLEFPLPGEDLTNVPDTIPLWFFDEEVGYWKEEGFAILEGNKFVGEVTHFSWWNCDIPLDYITFCFVLDDADNNSDGLYYIKIKRIETGQTIYCGNVYVFDKEVCGLIPRDEEIEISIIAINETCDPTITYQDIIGPYANSTTEIFQVSLSETIEYQIFGSVVDCQNEPVTNGYVFIPFEDIYFPIINGEINAVFQSCLSNIQFVAVDFDTNLVSEPVTIESGNTNFDFGVISSCETIQTGGVFQGDVDLNNQTEVNLFGLNGYTGIEGHLVIGDSEIGATSNITDLSPLSTIESVSSDLRILNNSLLENLDGLEGLNSIESLSVWNNTSLNDLNGLINLTTIEQGIDFRDNLLISNIDVFQNVVFSDPEFLSFINNDSLSDISMLSYDLATTMSHIRIQENPLLTNLPVFENLTLLAYLTVTDNPLISDLTNTNFPNVNNINNLEVISNENLSDIHLENLEFAPYLRLMDNPNLSVVDFPALNSVYTLEINNNDSLSSEAYFPNLEIAFNLFILGNANLINLDGFNSTVDITGTFAIIDNQVLNNIDAIGNNDVIQGTIDISRNPMLTDLSALSNLTEAHGLRFDNTAFTDLDGLMNLQILDNPNESTVPFLVISNNSVLTDLCGIQDYLSNTDINDVDVFISNNAIDRSIQDIIDGNCGD